MGPLRTHLAGRHIMLDGETFSTGEGCVFTQLAATEFWPDQPAREGRTWATYIDLADSMRLGRRLDASTLLWWLGEAGDEARSALVLGLTSRDRPPLSWREALEELAAFCATPAGRGMGHRPEPPVGVWSHGAAFDVSRVEAGYQDLRMERPWDFRAQRDTRTLFALAGSSLSRLAPPTRTKHDAAADTVQQVAAVHAALDTIDKEG